MKPRTRIQRRRQKPRRKRPELFFKRERSKFLDPRSYVTKGGRVRLFGEDYAQLGIRVYERACSKGIMPVCECGCGHIAWWMGPEESPGKGEIAHNEHGSRKSDELSRVKWMRHECHMRLHNPKSVPRKAA